MAQAFVSRFRREYTTQTAPNGVIDVICADERHAQGISLYRRTVAGAYGVGQDTNTARRLSGATELPKAHIQGSLVAKAAMKLFGIRMSMHEACAGEMVAPLIQYSIASNKGPDDYNVYNTIKPHYVDLYGVQREFPEERFNQFRKAAEDELAAGFDDLTTVQDFFDKGGKGPNGDALPALKRHKLIQMGHVGTHFVLDYEQGVALDTKAGLEEYQQTGNGLWIPPYSVSMGDSRELAGVVEFLYPGTNPADFHDAMFVRNATSSLYLPKQGPEGAQMPPQLFVAVG